VRAAQRADQSMRRWVGLLRYSTYYWQQLLQATERQTDRCRTDLSDFA
jgi:hypothetical protein